VREAEFSDEIKKSIDRRSKSIYIVNKKNSWKILEMRKVVSNTTPLISLSKISKIGFLKLIYHEIIISKGVFEEYQKEKI
jgi:hypothetical protein